MNSAAENVFLRNILLDAASKEFAEELYDKEAVATSAHFQHQMQSMIANPMRWAKQQRKPIWKQVMQTVAAVLIVCSLTLGSVMVVSPTARAAIIEWVTEWYEDSIIYRFFGEHIFDDMPRYKIAELPAGYLDTKMPLVLPNDIEINYENESGDTIRFEYMRVEEGSAIVMDTENMEILEIEINGNSGHLYMSQDNEQSNCITWYDDREKMQFIIDGFLEGNELQKMATSVLQVN
jgi:hypothetical protein